MKIRPVTAALMALASLAAGGVRAATSGSQIPNSAAANDPKEMRPDVEGEFKAPPPDMFATAAAPAPVVVDETVAVVEPTPAPVDLATTRCGLTVLSTSENAVGDPCATTADVIASLNLSDDQIAYVDAHSSIGEDQALAH